MWIELWKCLQELITLTPSPGQRERSTGREQRAGTLTVHLCDGNIYGALIWGLALGDKDEALSLNCLEAKGSPVSSTVARPQERLFSKGQAVLFGSPEKEQPSWGYQKVPERR